MTTTTAETTAESSQEADERYLASAPIFSAIVHLCIPLMLALAAGVLYNILNAYFIGTQHDTNLLAALTFGLPVYVLSFAIGGVFGAGGSAYIARLFGAGNKEEIRHASAFIFYSALITAVTISGIVLLFVGPLVTLVGAAGAAQPATTAYITGLLISTPIFVLAFTTEQIVRAMGAAKQSMYGLLVNTIANLIFDVLFIIILHMGVLGAALALGLSNLAGLIYYLSYLHRAQPDISFNPRLFAVNKERIREVFGVGASELIQSAFLLITTFVFNNLAVHYGAAILAGFGVANRIVQLPEALTMGVGIGILPLFAYNYGAKNFHRLRQGLLQAFGWVTVLILTFGSLLFLFRDQVFQLFSSDPNVLVYGPQALTAQLAAALFTGYTGLMMAYFQGTGKAKSAAALGFGLGGFFIPAVILGNLWFGADGILWAITAAEAASLLLGVALLFLFPHKQQPTSLEPNPATEIQAMRVGGELAG